MIILECYTDECLVKNLGFYRKQIAHERCKGEVLKTVRKKIKAVGLIDEDPQSSRPRAMKEYVQRKKKGDIKLFAGRNDKEKKVIQVSPRLEDWLLKRAKSNNIDPKKFNLPADPKKLHHIPHIEKKENFRRFLREIIDRDEEMLCLKKWLQEALE